ncbi:MULTISPECIES: HpcH/HpaI aldolase/citrate lyase family protein [Auritidibacter]|uniref:HpcH/HpaI aldolase/citrate lyase family protein n=1 Tax=Auritidibacter TaxID=1160973 RepID=UPI000D73CA33|nr:MULTISPECIES: CoA ester lyase [Auritidibacter]AXR73761.1 CoA ester lyase [Auritidibacter sp. NML130574]NIH72342.1 citrate lyase subunit beta/citryl-CoA lyase [Auritidibacter ignavus]PXA78808.1 CoA ester lyase [Auritidibacter sp. NML120636]RMX21941.1 CoA ester lyase [Auritidibacter ignavus]WGH82413.1 CoA ester lyase [Auritidibacter ignavus]
MNQPRDIFTLGPAILFCPADRPQRYIKAAERADAVILDLEDAVAPDAKDRARHALQEHLATTVAQDATLAARTIVRINPVGTEMARADLATLAGSSVTTVMVPKVESVHQLDAVASRLDDHVGMVALVETARGVAYAAAIAEHPRVVAMMWGAEDLIASMGGSSSRHADGTYRDVPRFARSQVMVAAASAGVACVDSIWADIQDLQGLRVEVEDAVATGFSAKACIHPSHVATIREGFTPSAADQEYARALLAAVEDHPQGVFSFRGTMVDGPLIAHARRIIARTG